MGKDDDSNSQRIDYIIRMLHEVWIMDMDSIIEIIESSARELKSLGYTAGSENIDDPGSLYVIAGILKLFNDKLESIIDNLRKSKEK